MHPIIGSCVCITLPWITIQMSVQKWNAHRMFSFSSSTASPNSIRLDWRHYRKKTALWSLDSLFLSKAHSGHLAGFGASCSMVLYEALYHLDHPICQRPQQCSIIYAFYSIIYLFLILVIQSTPCSPSTQIQPEPVIVLRCCPHIFRLLSFIFWHPSNSMIMNCYDEKIKAKFTQIMIFFYLRLLY